MISKYTKKTLQQPYYYRLIQYVQIILNISNSFCLHDKIQNSYFSSIRKQEILKTTEIHTMYM